MGSDGSTFVFKKDSIERMESAPASTASRRFTFQASAGGHYSDAEGKRPRKRMKFTTPEPQFAPIPAPWKARSLPSPTPTILAVSQLLPPGNFGIIKVDQIYRCGYPQDDHLDFIEGLKLRTIITLVDEPMSIPYKQMMERNGIRHIVSLVTPNKDKTERRKRTEVKQIWSVLDHMMDERNYPMLIHCNAGKHRSGCVSASYRKCMGAKMDDILDEYRGYAGAKARDLDIHFIRAFDEAEYLWSKTLKGKVTGPAPLDVDPVVDASSFSPKCMRIAKARV